MDKYCKAIELDKILARLAQLCSCEDAKAMALAIEPARDLRDVRELMQYTVDANTLTNRYSTPSVGAVENPAAALKRSEIGARLSPRELLDVGKVLRAFETIERWRRQLEGGQTSLSYLLDSVVALPDLQKHIADTIISEEEISDNASPELADIRRKIRQAGAKAREVLDKMVRSATYQKFLQDNIITQRDGRFVVPVKLEYRNEIKGLVHDTSSSGATVFIEPMGVVEANNEIRLLQGREQAEIDRILYELSAQVGGCAASIRGSYEAVVELDLYFAKSRLADEMHASVPAINDTGVVRLKKARHPLLDKHKVVPIDLSLGETFDTLVVTGPNTGGKTVTLKTAGLLCAMAQHGYLIPAHESSSVCVFGEILVDIGDEQSIEQSLSTFSGHIKNITGILKLAGPQTLVLMDELGAGTDPAEGAALAVSVIEALRGLGAKIMATTHYSELKIFALDTPGVQNASCEFNVETLRPTYRLSVGVPGKSNAFLISQKLGLAPEIIENARAHLSNEDQQFDNILNQLEDLKVELKAQQDEVERLKHTASHALEQAEEKRAALIRQGEEELAAAREKAHGMVQDVQNTAYGLMDELRKLEKDKQLSASQRAARAREIAKKETEKLFGKTDVVHAPQRTFKPLDSVKLGQEVLIAELDKPGIVTALPDRDGMVEVRAGIIKTKVPLNGLCAPHKQQPAPQKKYQPRRAPASASSGDKVTRTPSMEINLIGMTVEEALHEADKFIDNGVMNGQTTLYLIHGKGTGALRKGIHEHLRRHKNVRSFRLGVYGEGEAGVTVVELK